MEAQENFHLDYVTWERIRELTQVSQSQLYVYIDLLIQQTVEGFNYQPYSRGLDYRSAAILISVASYTQLTHNIKGAITLFQNAVKEGRQTLPSNI